MDPTSSTFAIYFDRVKFNCNFIYSRQLFPSQQFFGFLIDRRALNFGHTRIPVSVEFSSFLKHENSIKNIYIYFSESCWESKYYTIALHKLTKNFQSVAVRPTKSQWSADTFVLIQTRIYVSCGNEQKSMNIISPVFTTFIFTNEFKKRGNNTTHK